MNKWQYRRLLIALVSVLLLVAVAVCLLVVVINKPRDVEIRNYIGKDGQDGQTVIGPQGLVGPAGESIVGPQGLQGPQGNDGKPGVVETIINNIEIPVPGPKGEDSPKLFVQVDPVTCLMKSRYEGDDLWQVLAQLPKPCEVRNGQ